MPIKIKDRPAEEIQKHTSIDILEVYLISGIFPRANTLSAIAAIAMLSCYRAAIGAIGSDLAI